MLDRTKDGSSEPFSRKVVKPILRASRERRERDEKDRISEGKIEGDERGVLKQRLALA